MNIFQHYPADGQLLLDFDSTLTSFQTMNTLTNWSATKSANERANKKSIRMKTFLHIAPKPEIIYQELGNYHFTLLLLLMIYQLLIHAKFNFNSSMLELRKNVRVRVDSMTGRRGSRISYSLGINVYSGNFLPFFFVINSWISTNCFQVKFEFHSNITIFHALRMVFIKLFRHDSALTQSDKGKCVPTNQTLMRKSYGKPSLRNLADLFINA